MRGVLACVVVLASLTCAGCLRTPYNHCTETPPDRECELLDAGRDGGPDSGVADGGVDASTDAFVDDAAASDAGSADAGADAP